jgi:hypothetical protein
MEEEEVVFRIRLLNVVKTKKTAQSLDEEDAIYMAKSFLHNLLHNIVLRGIPGIDKVNLLQIQNYMVYNEAIGDFEKKEIYSLDTLGTNLLQVLALDYIDAERTFSNNIMETLDVLGIEAARKCRAVLVGRERPQLAGDLQKVEHVQPVAARTRHRGRLAEGPRLLPGSSQCHIASARHRRSAPPSPLAALAHRRCDAGEYRVRFGRRLVGRPVVTPVEHCIRHVCHRQHRASKGGQIFGPFRWRAALARRTAQ